MAGDIGTPPLTPEERERGCRDESAGKRTQPRARLDKPVHVSLPTLDSEVTRFDNSVVVFACCVAIIVAAFFVGVLVLLNA